MLKKWLENIIRAYDILKP